MPWFAWFLLGAVLGGSIGCLMAALAFAAGSEVQVIGWLALCWVCFGAGFVASAYVDWFIRRRGQVLERESYESRLHRYAMLKEAGRCTQRGCGADAAVKVDISSPDLTTGVCAYFCALHAEEGAADALAFVMRGRH